MTACVCAACVCVHGLYGPLYSLTFAFSEAGSLPVREVWEGVGRSEGRVGGEKKRNKKVRNEGRTAAESQHELFK